MKNSKRLVLKVTERSAQYKVPYLREVLEKFRPMPSEAIMLGMADDGLPVLINAKDTRTPNIIIWDKLARQGLLILKVIAEYVFKFRKVVSFKPYEVEFVVLTLHSEDWGELNEYGMGMMGNTSCIGIIPFYSELAGKVVRGLSKWIHEPHKSSKHPVIVLVDGMEHLEKMDLDFKTDFRYILTKGRSKNVYVVGTASKKNFAKVQEWLDGFGAEIYGSDVETDFQMEVGKETILFFTPVTEIV